MRNIDEPHEEVTQQRNGTRVHGPAQRQCVILRVAESDVRTNGALQTPEQSHPMTGDEAHEEVTVGEVNGTAASGGRADADGRLDR